ADPPVSELAGRTVTDLRRLGKRIVFAFDDDYFVVLHLMIAGRLHWKPAGAPIPRRAGLAAFDFPNGTLLLTEAGTKHRASLHVVRGERALAPHDPGGLDVLGATLEQFRGARVTRSRVRGGPRPHARAVRGRAPRSVAHAQAGLDRSPPVRRDRQRLLR